MGERFPSGKKNSRSEGLQGGKDFLAEKISQWSSGRDSHDGKEGKFGPLRLSPFTF